MLGLFLQFRVPVAGIAVIRLSDRRSRSGDKFHRAYRYAASKGNACHVKDPESGEPLDDGLVLVFPKPKSFTGEDVAELQCMAAGPFWTIS